MKKNLTILLTLLICFSFTTPVMSAPTVLINDIQLIFEDAQPIIEDGRTLVPLRAIFEAMGAVVEWNQDIRTATAIKDNTAVVLEIGSTTPTVNGQINKLDIPAKIVNGRTLAPLRFVGEAFGGTVDWDADTQTITIQTSTSVISEQPAPQTTDPEVIDKYIGSIKSDRYHYPSCRHTKTIASENQIWFTDKAAAEAAGYIPCKVCLP